VGGVEEDVIEVPVAVGEMDEVDAGVGEADGGELEAAAPEGADAEGRVDGSGADDGLVAEGGVFVDDEVFEGEAGEREEIQGYPIQMDGTAEAFADACCDALLIAIETDEWWKQNEEEDSEGGEGDVEKTAEGSAADGWRDVGVRGGDVNRLVGWIHFLHLSSQLSVLSSQLFVADSRQEKLTPQN
jgi:hypothetical protein